MKIDAFRIFGGFELLARKVNMDTIPIIMPIFMCLLHENHSNRKYMSKHLICILKKVFAQLPDGNKITTTAMAVDLVGNCARDDECQSLLVNQPVNQPWTMNLGLTALSILSMKKNSVRGSVHIYYALCFAHSLLSSVKGIDSFIRVYRFDLTQFVTFLSQHLTLDGVEGETKSFSQLCLECLEFVLKAEIPAKPMAVNHGIASLLPPLMDLLKQKDSPRERIIGVLHNLFIYLDHSLPDTLSSTELPAWLYKHYIADPKKHKTSWLTLSKLVKHHPRLISTTLVNHWQFKEMVSALQDPEDSLMVKASLQLLSCWLQCSETHVNFWMKSDGFKLLIGILKKEERKNEMDGFITGNMALCLGECARRGKFPLFFEFFFSEKR